MHPSESPPVFLIGAARSGTSLLYKMLCLHPEVAWISNWVRRFPRVPELAALNRVAGRLPATRQRVWFGADASNAYVYGRARSPFERMFPMPVEGEPVFEHCGIPELGGVEAADPQRAALRRAVARIVRADGGLVFVNKRIANNRRIPLLVQAFPGARFVEIVRDGRAVAYSLSRVDWWPDSQVWFYGDTPRRWQAEGGDPWVLCARNWVEELRAIEAGSAAVPAAQLVSVRYEDLVACPVEIVAGIAKFAGLSPDPAWLARLGDLSFTSDTEPWRTHLGDSVATIEEIQRDDLSRLGYAD